MTKNPRPAVTIIGKVEVPRCDGMTMEVRDRAELTVGQPLVINQVRYIITARMPAEVGPPGANIFVALVRDKTTRKQRLRANAGKG